MKVCEFRFVRDALVCALLFVVFVFDTVRFLKFVLRTNRVHFMMAVEYVMRGANAVHFMKCTLLRAVPTSKTLCVSSIETRVFLVCFLTADILQ